MQAGKPAPEPDKPDWTRWVQPAAATSEKEYLAKIYKCVLFIAWIIGIQAVLVFWWFLHVLTGPGR